MSDQPSTSWRGSGRLRKESVGQRSDNSSSEGFWRLNSRDESIGSAASGGVTAAAGNGSGGMDGIRTRNGRSSSRDIEKERQEFKLVF